MGLKSLPSSFRWLAFLALGAPLALAQRSSFPNMPRANSPAAPIPGQLIVIAGTVAIDGGLPLTEPVAVERLCHGEVRREGYTDLNGHFAIQLGQNTELSDASENVGNALQNTSSGLPIVGAAPVSSSMARNVDAARRQLSGCQVRAVLAGFQSTSVLIMPDGNSWRLDLGTIHLARMEDAEGTTISLTTLSAPDEARRIYQKGQKELMERKSANAERDLNRAVEIYPRLAAAWVLLGEIHRQQGRPDLATENYKQAIAADPQFVNPYFGLAILAFHDKNWADTVRLTEQVARLDSTAFPLAHLYNASANFYLGRLEPAEHSARRFQSLDTERRQPYAYLLLAQILGAKRDFNGAIAELETYLRLAPAAGNADAARDLLKHYREAGLAQAAALKQP